jgi:hypothetical protein
MVKKWQQGAKISRQYSLLLKSFKELNLGLEDHAHYSKRLPIKSKYKNEILLEWNSNCAQNKNYIHLKDSYQLN